MTDRIAPSRVRRFAFPAAFALLSCASVAPIVRWKVPPLADLPEHAAQVALWQAWSTDPDVHAHYTLHPLSSYTAVYFLWRGLTSCGLSLMTAGRIVVAVVVLALPVSLLVLLNVRRRPVEWSLLSFPMLYTYPLAWGFLPFCLSMSLALFATALFSWWLSTGGWLRALGVCAGGVAVVWSHGLTAGFWGLTCGWLSLLRRATWTQRVVGLVPLLPVGLLLFGWSSQTLSGSPHTGVVDPQVTLGKLTGYLFGSLTAEARVVAQGTLHLWCAIFVVALLVRRPGGIQSFLKSVDAPLLAAAGVGLLLYFVVPVDVLGGNGINRRFLPLSFLLAMGALPPVAWPPARVVACAAAVVMSLLVFFRVDRAFGEFDRAVGDVEALFSKLPHGASIAVPEGAEHEWPPLKTPVLWHFSGWGQAQALGPSNGFTNAPQMLVRDSRDNPPTRPGAALVPTPGGGLSIGTIGQPLPDYLVFRTEAAPADTLPVVGGGGRYVLAGRSATLNLFRHEP